MTDYQKEFEESRKSPYFKAMSAILDVIYDISRIMKSKKINKKELAKKMDVSPAYITKIMKGEQNLSMETIAKIAVALDCDFIAPKIYETEICDIDLYDYSTLNYEQEGEQYKLQSIENTKRQIFSGSYTMEGQRQCSN